jgi:hypothetical protein
MAFASLRGLAVEALGDADMRAPDLEEAQAIDDELAAAVAQARQLEKDIGIYEDPAADLAEKLMNDLHRTRQRVARLIERLLPKED